MTDTKPGDPKPGDKDAKNPTTEPVQRDSQRDEDDADTTYVTYTDKNDKQQRVTSEQYAKLIAREGF